MTVGGLMENVEEYILGYLKIDRNSTDGKIPIVEGVGVGGRFMISPVKKITKAGEDQDGAYYDVDPARDEDVFSISEDYLYGYLVEMLQKYLDPELQKFRMWNGCSDDQFDWYSNNIYSCVSIRAMIDEIRDYIKNKDLNIVLADFYSRLCERLIVMMDQFPHYALIVIEGP